jgi:hypothetical protein
MSSSAADRYYRFIRDNFDPKKIRPIISGLIDLEVAGKNKDKYIINVNNPFDSKIIEQKITLFSRDKLETNPVFFDIILSCYEVAYNELLSKIEKNDEESTREDMIMYFYNLKLEPATIEVIIYPSMDNILIVFIINGFITKFTYSVGKKRARSIDDEELNHRMKRLMKGTAWSKKKRTKRIKRIKRKKTVGRRYKYRKG